MRHKDKEQNAIARSKLVKTAKDEMRHKNKEDYAVALSKLDKTIKDKLRQKQWVSSNRTINVDKTK